MECAQGPVKAPGLLLALLYGELMPRYYFDTDGSDRFKRDVIGQDLDGPETARQSALEALADMARDALPEDGDKRLMTVRVRDAAGRSILKASLSLLVERQAEQETLPSLSLCATNQPRLPALLVRTDQPPVTGPMLQDGYGDAQGPVDWTPGLLLALPCVRLMPRYYFDTDDGNRFKRDVIGRVLDGPGTVRRAALETLSDMARDALPEEGDKRLMSVRVRDAEGHFVLKASLSLLVER